MELTRGNKYMFATVDCHAYLKRIKDGRFFEPIIAEKGGKQKTVGFKMIGLKDIDGQDIETECTEYDGSEQLIKTYYERVEKDFCGVIVATKMVTMSQTLYADWAEPEYGPDYPFIGKADPQQVKCGRVYYGNGLSRLVPLDDIEIKETA